MPNWLIPWLIAAVALWPLVQIEKRVHRQIQALDEIALDFENIRMAWTRALERLNYAAIGGAAESLANFLHMRSRWKDDSYLLDRAQERLAPQDGERCETHRMRCEFSRS